jgi:tRNA(Glu) U13 pseudouridine synthase TruD
LRIEQEVFAGVGLAGADFRGQAIGKVKGARRPVRVRPEDVDLAGGVDEHGGYIAVAFTLPAGSFATVLLGELMKKPGEAPAAEAEVETAVEEPE